MDPEEGCDKITIHSNAHKLLFDSEITEIKVKQNINPIVEMNKGPNKKVHRAPQLQKAPMQKSENVGYSQKYVKQKTYSSPKKEEDSSPISAKIVAKPNKINPLFQANPLPNLDEEYKEANSYSDSEGRYTDRLEDAQPISNYKYHNQHIRNQNVQPHELKKANFEQNRKSNITNVSSNIVASRENIRSGAVQNDANSKINHSQNRNQGYVKITTQSQGESKMVVNNVNSKSEQLKLGNQLQKQSNSQIIGKENRKVEDSILQQYSQNMPPIQIEYKSGFQEIPPPIYNANEDLMYK